VIAHDDDPVTGFQHLEQPVEVQNAMPVVAPETVREREQEGCDPVVPFQFYSGRASRRSARLDVLALVRGINDSELGHGSAPLRNSSTESLPDPVNPAIVFDREAKRQFGTEEVNVMISPFAQNRSPPAQAIAPLATKIPRRNNPKERPACCWLSRRESLLAGAP
jgi:hypothetical protein